TYFAGASPSSIAVAQLDSDPGPDIVVTNTTAGTVSVLRNNGDGTFGPRVPFPVGAAPSSVAVGDLNGDAFPDLAVTNQDGDSVSVLLGNGAGAFSASATLFGFHTPTSVGIGRLVTQPVRGPGGPQDLAVANSATGTVSIVANITLVRGGPGAPTFEAPVE